MHEIRGLAAVEGQIGVLGRSLDGKSVDLVNWSVVQSCHLQMERDADRDGTRFDLVMASQRQSAPHHLRIILRNVRGLCLDGLGVGSTVTGLTLVDVSERQWEGITWQLGDYEDGRIKCYAEEAELVIEPVA